MAFSRLALIAGAGWGPVWDAPAAAMTGFGVASALRAQDVGESVPRRGTVQEDLYLAGGNVNVAATAEADVVAAGGNVTVGDDIKGDALLAGGRVRDPGVGDDRLRLREIEVLLADGDGRGLHPVRGEHPGADGGLERADEREVTALLLPDSAVDGGRGEALGRGD